MKLSRLRSFFLLNHIVIQNKPYCLLCKTTTYRGHFANNNSVCYWQQCHTVRNRHIIHVTATTTTCALYKTMTYLKKTAANVLCSIYVYVCILLGLRAMCLLLLVLNDWWKFLVQVQKYIENTSSSWGW